MLFNEFRHSEIVREGHRILSDNAQGVAIIGLFSGGNDSTVMMHLSRGMLTHAAHINTGIGIPETTQFVRAQTAAWGIPLIELVTPPEVYDGFVLRWGGGFPGPSGHQAIYYYLKQKRLRELRRQFVTRLGQRVVFVTGIRASESRRRAARKMARETTREGSIVWVCPIIHFTDETMAWYREEYDVPQNPVAANLHRSGECLCGAFMNPAELDEIGFFYPEVAGRIRALEAQAREMGVKRPGWGGGLRRESPTQGFLCSNCTLPLFPDLPASES